MIVHTFLFPEKSIAFISIFVQNLKITSKTNLLYGYLQRLRYCEK